MNITFFFPDNADRKPITVVGQVPIVGDFVYFSTYELTKGNLSNKWKVDRVDYSVRNSIQEVYEPSYHAEVHVVPAEVS